jgi:hypothetical protein
VCFSFEEMVMLLLEMAFPLVKGELHAKMVALSLGNDLFIRQMCLSTNCPYAGPENLFFIDLFPWDIGFHL